MPRYTFRRQQRLVRQRDFQRVMRNACSAADPRLTVCVAENDTGRTRLGIGISRRVGSAVKRNRIKRLIRESFRLLQHELPAGLDLVVIPRRDDQPTLEGYQCSLRALICRAARKLSKRRT